MTYKIWSPLSPLTQRGFNKLFPPKTTYFCCHTLMLTSHGKKFYMCMFFLHGIKKFLGIKNLGITKGGEIMWPKITPTGLNFFPMIESLGSKTYQFFSTCKQEGFPFKYNLTPQPFKNYFCKDIWPYFFLILIRGVLLMLVSYRVFGGWKTYKKAAKPFNS